LPAVRDCLFNIFAAISISGGRLHQQIEDVLCRGDRDAQAMDGHNSKITGRWS